MENFANRARGARLTAVLGHYSSELLIVSIFAAITVGVYPLPGVLSFSVPVIIFAFVIASWLLMRQHDRRLCEQCVLSMPLNPAALAARYGMRFKVTHAFTEPRVFVPYLVVLIGSSFEMNTIGRIPWALIQFSMIYLILSQSTHRKLQPWCPQCQGGGGGDEVLETPPVLPHDDRQLV